MCKVFSFVLALLTINLTCAEKVTPEEGFAMLKSGEALIIDVREEKELKATGKVAPALWLATSSIETKDTAYQNTVAKLSKDKVLIFYCASGRRADSVAAEFEELGYQTRNMGGFSDWEKAGLPVSK